MDLTRRSSDLSSIYDPIEAIKNGFLRSTKYETDYIMMNDIHVVIFSNRMPHLEWCSQDRWKVYEIVDNDTSVLLATEADVERCIAKDIETHESRRSKNIMQY